ncbi:hypothetical protein LB523_16700 [Mesorhizobium sp. ESP-6-4]|uniref:hypothetical protein n=1 Tax=Mesorhizobium sp. ESP-6-4 TaxID=2876624 RepID=UPI001CCBDF55|nr:hypothetical protein [Mesorhizobium sp. ESP-6-4]MBZ9660694.1 hypothetical protein [Mesorhizobium sp. ESP-6-4]
MSKEDLQQKIRRQMQADFRSDPREAIERFGLTTTVQRGVVRTVVAAGVILVGFLIWAAIHH